MIRKDHDHCYKCSAYITTICVFGRDGEKPTWFCVDHQEDAWKLYELNKLRYKESIWVKTVNEIYGEK